MHKTNYSPQPINKQAEQRLTTKSPIWSNKINELIQKAVLCHSIFKWKIWALNMGDKDLQQRPVMTQTVLAGLVEHIT